MAAARTVPITDVVVTYGDSMAPPGYHRITGDSKMGVDVNKLAGGPPTYLWLREEKGAPAITGIDIVYEDEEAPEGFEKLAKNLARGSGTRAYLCTRKQPKQDAGAGAGAGGGGDDGGGDGGAGPEVEGDGGAAPAPLPLDRVAVLFEAEPAAEGFETLDKPLLRAEGAAPVRLCFSRCTEADLQASGKEWSAHQLKEGDWVDALDTVQTWRVAQVIELEEERVKVHFKNWGARWDRWCRKGGRELAELASHTAGKDTGWSQRAAGAAWAVSAADVDGMIEQLRAASTGQLPPQEADALLRADVPHFVEACLSSTFTDPQMAKGVRINGFLQEVLVAFARDLRTPAPVSGAMLTMCGRIYCLEKAYTWFYKNHGHDFYDPEPEDPPVAGPVAVAGGDGADGAPLSPTAAAPPPPPSPAQPPPPPPPMDYVHQKRDASGAIPVPVSRFFLQNFNKLGMEKGYEAFVARLGGLPLPQGAAAKGAAKGEGSQEKEGAKFFMPIEEVTQICNMIKLPCTHYVPKFGAAYFPRLHAAMLEYVRTLTEERVKEVTPAKLGEFMRVVDKLFESTLTPKAAAAEATETLSLEVARRLLFFPSLQLQLRGAARLRELCDMTDRKDHPQRYRTNVSYYGYQAIGSSGSGYGRTRPDPVAVWLTGAELTRWLVENEVAELMLGDTDVLTKHKLQAPHIEILRRSEIVLQHLSQQKLLTVKHLQLLWEQSKVDGNAPVVHDLVTKTCRGWTLEQVDFLFDKVKDIGVGEYCDETIQMVKTITRYSIIRHKHLEDQPVADGEERPPEKQRWLGLKFLWAVAFSDAAVEATIKLSALAAIAELLGTPFCKPVRAEYFEQCVNNVCESSHVESSLRLLQLVAEKQDENRYSYNHSDAVSEADNILLQLESDHGLLRLLVREATRFTRNEAGLALPALRDAVKSRLAFLEYYLSHTPHLTLQLEQAVLLWDCLVAKDDGRGFSELFFDWLSDLLPKYTNSYGEVAMLDETIQEVFDQLLCSAERMGDFVKLGERGFMCFHIYFRRVNGTQQRMREPMHAQYCSVSDFDLSGLDSLWAIMMNVENTDVALAAIQFLVHLFTNFAQPQAPKRDIWSSHFLQPCMKRVATAAHALAQAPSDAASDRQIQRILMLLRIFVDKVENSTPDYKRNESGVRVMVRKSASGGVLRDRTFILQRTATVGELRQRIADDLKVRGDRVRLTNMRRIDLDVAQHNVLTLERAQIFNHCDAVLLDAPEDDTRGHEPPPKGPLTPAEEDRRYPCETLSNTPDYFNLLFKLLELSPEVQEKAWELLQLLPVNKRMDEELKTLNGKVCKSPTNASAKGMVVDGEVPWAQLLDEDSALKLLYQLQIVEGQLGLGAADNAEQWHECFLQAGGFGHLYRIFMAFDPVKMTSGPLLKACLAKLISLVSIFLCASEDIAEAPGHAWFSPLVLSDFVTQLLVVLKANVASSNPSRPLAVVDVEDSDSDLDDNTSTIPQAEADVARHTIVSLVRCVSSSPSLLSVMYSFEGLEECLLFALLSTDDGTVRSEVAKGIDSMCASYSPPSVSEGEVVKAPLQFFVPMLLRALPVACQREELCVQYFSLVEALLVQIHEKHARHGLKLSDCIGQSIRAICDQLRSFVLGHATVEVTAEDEDDVLGGVLRVFSALLAASATDGAEQSMQLKLSIGGSTHANLVGYLFDECLFAIPTPQSRESGINPPMCKSTGSRSAAFGLLRELTVGCRENYGELLDLVAPHHGLVCTREERRVQLRRRRRNRKPKTNTGWHQPARSMASLARSKAGFVGLKNLGCICYMNSTLQQLFMVPRLRHGILTLPDDEEEGEKAESMMYQLQTMFANLQESEKQCYNPQPFCHAFKDWEGAPVDVLVQQDIHEFLTNFFQQVENNLSEMSKKEAEILKNTVGGSFCHELIADGGRYSAREEPFYFWSVNIKGCKDLGQAMEKEMEGETVEYTWEEKQEDGSEKKTKLNTKKRMSLKTLPDHLFIHLKRFEMDFETMQQVKINDKLEFPHDLDMLSYTVEGRAQQEAQAKAAAAEAGEEDGEAAVDGGGVPQEGEQDEGGEESKEEADSGKPQQPEIKSPEHYKYELAGVVVHMGVANSGHYYSYIKDRNACGKSAKWFEFNDELVCPFDPSQIESECFGGEETFQGYGNHGGGVSTYGGTQGYSREKIRNAFVLVYDRVQAKPEPTTPAARAASATPTREVLAAPVMASEAPKAPASPLQRRNSRRHSSMLASRAPVPPAIFERIWKANTDFWQRANVTDSSYMQFMAHFVSEGSIRANSDSVGEARLLSTGFRFLLTLSRSFSRQDAPLMQKLAQSLQILYAGNDEACEVLLRSLATTPSLCALEEIFLEFEQPAVRQAIAGVCVVCMRNVLKRTPIVSFESGKMENVALMFVDALIQHLPSARAHWQQNSSEYCWMLVQFCTVLLEDEEARVEARRYFIEQGVLRLVIHCTVGSESPHQELSSAAEPGIATVATGTADVPVSSDYASLLELIHLLMVSCIPTIPAQEIEQVGGIQTMPPTLQPPSLAMHEVDHDMVTCGAFLLNLCQTCDVYRHVQFAQPIIHHICWCSPSNSRLVIDAIKGGVEKLDGDLLRPFFTVLGIICSMDDHEELSFSRMAYALKEVFGVMHEMRQYADATYVSINCVLKLASTKPRILNWMTQEANHSAWNWIEAWLRLKEKQASSTYNTATYGYPSQMPSANLIRARKMLAHVHDFLESRPVQVRLYDESDDPRTLIGRDVIIETQRARLDATVVDYDDATGLHTVVADGVDYTYNLLDQHFLFVEQHVPSDDDDDSEEDAVGTSSDEPYVAGHERPASP